MRNKQHESMLLLSVNYNKNWCTPWVPHNWQCHQCICYSRSYFCLLYKKYILCHLIFWHNWISKAKYPNLLPPLSKSVKNNYTRQGKKAWKSTTSSFYVELLYYLVQHAFLQCAHNVWFLLWFSLICIQDSKFCFSALVFSLGPCEGLLLAGD